MHFEGNLTTERVKNLEVNNEPINKTRRNTYGSQDFDFTQLEQIVAAPTRDETGVRAALFMFSLASLLGTGFFNIREVMNGIPNVPLNTFLTLSGGISLGTLYSAGLPSGWLKKTNRVISQIAYPWYLFPATQLYDNLGTAKDKRIMHEWMFVFVAGFLLSRDVYTRFVASRSDFEVDDDQFPANENEYIPMLHLKNTRNETAFKFWFVSRLINVVAITTLFFTLKDQYSGDLHAKYGFYGTIAAVYSGSEIGRFLACFFDNYKNKLARDVPDWKSACAKTVGNTYSLIGISLLGLGLQLSSSNIPKIDGYVNSPGHYCSAAVIGMIWGSLCFLTNRADENPKSPYFERKKVVEIPEVEEEQGFSCRRVSEVAKHYFFSMTFLAGLLGYSILVGVTSDEPILKGAVSIMFISTILSYLGTTLVMKMHHPHASDEKIPDDATVCQELVAGMKSIPLRCMNQLHSYLRNPYQVAFPYGLMRTMFKIDDQSIVKAPPQVLAALLMTWLFWGMALGNNLALYDLREEPNSLTDPLSVFESTKAIVKGFR